MSEKKKPFKKYGGVSMNIERNRMIFWIFFGVVSCFFFIVFVIFLYFSITRPQNVPPSETFWSFWLKNFSLFIAAVAFAFSALATAYNAIEQRHLLYMENYPYLEVFPIYSVDPLPLPIPKQNFPDELASFNADYLHAFPPSHPHEESDTNFRYAALALRNVGNGYITRITVKGEVEVPGVGFPPVQFVVERRFNLNPDDIKFFTLFPISGLPEFRIILSSVDFYGYFVKLSLGRSEFQDSCPFDVPPERSDIFFDDDFYQIPAGNGWIMDFWGHYQPTEYMLVPEPLGDDHYMLLSGDDELFSKVYHWKDQGGAYKDFLKFLDYGLSVRVSARVRSTKGTTAKIQLWCHDINPNQKNRMTNAITPSESWEDISMVYTSTQSPDLRVHLLYSPGEGEIHIDRVVVEVLYT